MFSVQLLKVSKEAERDDMGDELYSDASDDLSPTGREDGDVSDVFGGDESDISARSSEGKQQSMCVCASCGVWVD